MNCPNCGAEVLSDNEKFCRKCGFKLVDSEVKKATGDAKKLKVMHAWVDSGADNYNAEERDKEIAIQTLEKIIKKIKSY